MSAERVLAGHPSDEGFAMYGREMFTPRAPHTVAAMSRDVMGAHLAYRAGGAMKR